MFTKACSYYHKTFLRQFSAWLLIHSWFSFIYFAAMDMKAVKEEIAEEEDDDVPGR